MIKVTKQDNDSFKVTVEENGTSSNHTVTVSDSYHQKLTGGKITKEELLRKSFGFLLERESKESILSSFELPAIKRYFPEYENSIQQH
jgi:hypothetical protein